ncbi:MAG TPA: hypothetical protein PLP19_10365 [bacterium]|nr:hypothetical protein [bacterium]HPN43882.1 hypothetical protein [bacterium]
MHITSHASGETVSWTCGPALVHSSGQVVSMRAEAVSAEKLFYNRRNPFSKPFTTLLDDRFF